MKLILGPCVMGEGDSGVIRSAVYGICGTRDGGFDCYGSSEGEGVFDGNTASIRFSHIMELGCFSDPWELYLRTNRCLEAKGDLHAWCIYLRRVSP